MDLKIAATHVAANLGRGIVTSLDHGDSLNRDFNTSSSVAKSVLELAVIIWQKIKGDDVKMRIVNDKAFEYDIERRIPNFGKARNLLGFRASTC